MIPVTPFVLMYHAGKHLSARSRKRKALIPKNAKAPLVDNTPELLLPANNKAPLVDNTSELLPPANDEAKLFKKVLKAKQALKALHSELSEKLSDEKTARDNLSNAHDKEDIKEKVAEFGQQQKMIHGFGNPQRFPSADVKPVKHFDRYTEATRNFDQNSAWLETRSKTPGFFANEKRRFEAILETVRQNVVSCNSTSN